MDIYDVLKQQSPTSTAQAPKRNLIQKKLIKKYYHQKKTKKIIKCPKS